MNFVLKKYPEAIAIGVISTIYAVLRNHDVSIFGSNFSITSNLFVCFQLCCIFRFWQNQVYKTWHVFVFLGFLSSLFFIMQYVPNDLNAQNISTFNLSKIDQNYFIYFILGLSTLMAAKPNFFSHSIHGEEDSIDSYSNRAQRLVLATIVASAVVVFLYLANYGLYFAISRLFDIKINHYLSDTFAILFSIGFYFSFLFLYEYFAQKLSNSILKIQYILVPVCLIYLVVINAYVIKIAIMATAKGTLASLTIGVGIMTMFTHVICERSYFKIGFIAFFHKFAYLMLILPTAGLGYSLYIRIQEYGLTYSRYNGVLFFITLFCALIYFSWRSQANKQRFFMIIGAALFLLPFTPLKGDFMVLRSQKSRLIHILKEHKSLGDNLKAFVTPPKDKKSLPVAINIINYMYYNLGPNSLQFLFSDSQWQEIQLTSSPEKLELQSFTSSPEKLEKMYNMLGLVELK